MSEQDEKDVTRRGFLKAVAVTAVAASATGAGAALLSKSSASGSSTTGSSTALSASNTVANMVPTAVNTNASVSVDTLADLAAAHAENVRLQAALDAAQRQLTALQQNSQDAAAASEAYSIELGQANERIGILSGLVALYEQLDDVDASSVMDAGLLAVSTSILDLIDTIPSLEESMDMGKQALTDLENHIPVLESGRLWLHSHIQKLQSYFEAIQFLLEKAVEKAGPFLQMLNEWFAGVKKWLPFGIGETAAEIMQSITDLIIETPYTIAGLNTNVAEPLNVWLVSDPTDDEVPLHKNLIKPIRDETFVKTGQTVSKAKSVETTYNTNLKEPLETAVHNQRLIRQLITDYRARHQI